MTDPVELSDLRSGVLTSPADALLGEAIAATLRLPAEDRAVDFEDRMRGIEAYIKARPGNRGQGIGVRERLPISPLPPHSRRKKEAPIAIA